MAGGIGSTYANQALDAGTGGTTNVMGFVSQHTADPGTTGASEYSSTTRQAMTWNAASGRAKTNSGTATLTNSGATPVTDLGTWSLVSSGVFGVTLHLSSSITAASIGVAAGALSVSC